MDGPLKRTAAEAQSFMSGVAVLSGLVLTLPAASSRKDYCFAFGFEDSDLIDYCSLELTTLSRLY